MARYDAALFDLLTALLDSWSLFDAIDPQRGFEWRKAYLRRCYAAGAYIPIEQIAVDSARDVGLPESHGRALIDRWAELEPWPEAREVLTALGARVRLGIVTNCSERLGAMAAARVGVSFAAITTAEGAGFYKPDPRTYRAALDALGTPPERTLFVAGSPGDVAGATGAGMDVFWHNRRGLPLPKGSPRPIAEERSLHRLLEVVR